MFRRKNLIELVLLVLGSTSISTAQTVKILFDATKAEMAGNADWVIDADNYNLGYNNGPAVIGQGSEADPVVLPTPLQSTISTATAETYWDGGISYWGIDCVRQGYQVQTLPYNGRITYGNSSNAQDLSNYSVFVVCEPNILFSAAEKTAILQFVQNGGGLFMISDHDVSDRNGDGDDSPHIWNDLMSSNSIITNPFGITFDYANISQTSSNVIASASDSVLHGPYGNVTQVQWSNGTTMTLDPSVNASVRGVVYKSSSTQSTTNVMFATARYGNGKVAAIGDSSPFDDGTGDPNDQLYNGYTQDANGNHRKLIMNATIWLATPATLTGLTMPADGMSPEFNLWPNPASDELTIHLPVKSSVDALKLFDPVGRQWPVLQKSHSESKMVLDVTALPSGCYFLQLSGSNAGSTLRFIKR